MKNSALISKISDLRNEIKERTLFSRLFVRSMFFLWIPTTIICSLFLLLMVVGWSFNLKIVFIENNLILGYFISVLCVLTSIVYIFVTRLPDKIASRLAKIFFMRKMNFAFETFLNDLGIKNSEEETLEDIFFINKEETFAGFAGFLKLNLYFSFENCQQKKDLKKDGVLSIIISKFSLKEEKISDSKIIDIAVIEYNQIEENPQAKGQSFTKMYYQLKL